MKKFILAAACILLGLTGAFAQEGQDDILNGKEKIMWNSTWNNFFCEDTNIFYDYINSFNKADRFKLFPTPEEIKAEIPNKMGYYTGMENACLNADMILIGLLEKYKATKDISLANYASKIFSGIINCTLEHPNKGFVIRGKSPFDNKSFYPVTSRDQITHAVHGIWSFYNSGLSSQEEKSIAKEAAEAIADYMIKQVTPENNYDVCDYYGRRPDNNIVKTLTKMWNVEPHEAARLPMVYIVAYKISGKQKYLDEYKKYIDDAIEQTSLVKDNVVPWGHFQMHLSLATIYEAESDPAIKSRIKELLKKSALMAQKKMPIVVRKWKKKKKKWNDMKSESFASSDWRDSPDDAKKWSASRKQFYNTWLASEAPTYMALCMIIGNTVEIDDGTKQLFRDFIIANDYEKIPTVGGVGFNLTLYWTAKSNNLL